jgi:UDP-glucose 4-epimerase
LIQFVERGIPLPFGCVSNLRSFVGVSNLVSFIQLCMVHPAAAGETFLISDGEDMSTAMLVRALAKALDKPARLLPIPVSVLRGAATVLGKSDTADRVLGSLQCDSQKARAFWSPVCSVEVELAATVRAYLAR